MVGRIRTTSDIIMLESSQTRLLSAQTSSRTVPSEGSHSLVPGKAGSSLQPLCQRTRSGIGQPTSAAEDHVHCMTQQLVLSFFGRPGR
jgi:hypothetical protein